MSSLAIPGAGQLYNGQILKGIAYFLASSSLMAGVVVDPAITEVTPTLWPMVGATVWGASVADAVYNVHRREQARPRLGAQLVAGASYSDDPTFPWHIGFSGDVMLRPGISLGIDRVGLSRYADLGWDAHIGSRLWWPPRPSDCAQECSWPSVCAMAETGSTPCRSARWTR